MAIYHVVGSLSIIDVSFTKGLQSEMFQKNDVHSSC